MTDEEKIKRVHKDHPEYTVKQIAEGAGVSTSAVYNLARRDGLTIVPARRGPKRVKTPAGAGMRLPSIAGTVYEDRLADLLRRL